MQDFRTPTAATDLTNKGYVDAEDALAAGGIMTAVDHGALAWTTDPQTTGTTTPTGGSVYATVFKAAASGTCTKIWMHCSVLGSPTAVYAGIYDLSGNQLGITANVASSFTSTGQKSLALASGVALVAGQKYVAVFVESGGTIAAVVASVGATSPALAMTATSTAPLRQSKTTSTSRTTLTNPETAWNTGYAVVGNAPLMLMAA